MLYDFETQLPKEYLNAAFRKLLLLKLLMVKI